MKRAVCTILMIFLAVISAACGNVPEPPATPDSAAAEPGSVPQNEDAAAAWSRQDILALFEPNAEPDWTIVDAVPASDFAYDRVGVILFVDNDTGYTGLAFMHADGHFARCGTAASPASPAGLTYHGNGIVTFLTQTEDGVVYESKLSYSLSEDKRETNFVLEDNLQEILSGAE